MHKTQGLERIVLWKAMVLSLRSCFNCTTLLRSTANGFCDECIERSQRCRDDELGGEA